MADEEISEDQESCFTEDGMEDLYDDESYLDDEEENGLADVETDFDEDKYNEKLDQHLSEMQKHGDLKENASKNNPAQRYLSSFSYLNSYKTKMKHKVRR